METTIIICPDCRRVIAVGASLPAICFIAVPQMDLRIGATDLDSHPMAHKRCIELPVTASADLDGDALIASISSAYADQIRQLCDTVVGLSG
jgi:hypothetical protein